MHVKTTVVQIITITTHKPIKLTVTQKNIFYASSSPNVNKALSTEMVPTVLTERHVTIARADFAP